ncbi:hypothetical protein [Paractinoplanes durhamensis]|uniref:hypothetical protein n=1 Tax=Paractinoplanes durhamensis TaxID=113563 RepID=UPI0036386EBF
MSLESLLVRHRRLALASTLGIIVLALAVSTRYLHHSISGPAFLVAWWLGNTMLLFLVFAFLRRDNVRRQPMATGRIVAIVPAYEQSTKDLAACVHSILDQRGVVVDQVHVVDDGSTSQPVEPFLHPGSAGTARRTAVGTPRPATCSTGSARTTGISFWSSTPTTCSRSTRWRASCGRSPGPGSWRRSARSSPAPPGRTCSPGSPT